MVKVLFRRRYRLDVVAAGWEIKALQIFLASNQAATVWFT